MKGPSCSPWRGSAAAQPANHVHVPRCRAARFRRNHIEQRRENVGIVQALEESPGDQRHYQPRRRFRHAAQRHERRAAEDTRGLHHHAAAGCAPAQRIRHPAAQRRARHAGQLHENRRGQARHGQPQVELVVEEFRHPRQQHDGDEIGAHERAHETQQRRRPPHQRQKRRQRQPARGQTRV